MAAAVYIAGFVLLGWLVLDQALPELGPRGAWFYSGAAMLLLSAALVDPFYTRPADCIVNAVAAGLMTSAFPVTAGLEAGASSSAIQTGRALLLGFFATMVVAGLLAAVLKDEAGWRGRAGANAARICRRFGTSRVLFSLTFLGSVYAVYSRLPSVAAVLFLAWIVVFIVRPAERMLTTSWSFGPSSVTTGRVIGVRHPGLVELGLRPGVSAHAGSKFETTKGEPLTVLDEAPMGEGTWALAYSATDLRVDEAVYAAHGQSPHEGLGPVEPGSTLVDLRVRLPAESEALREGNLVSARVRGEKVLFQVVAATAKSETVAASTQHRFVEVVARKIGAWDEKERAFVRVPWLPAPGSLVAHELATDTSFQPDAIGVVPDSGYGIRFDPHLAVTHNTAVLGILGIGKTFLTFELMRRIMAERIKVVALDITGQFAPHFRELFPEWYEMASTDCIAKAIEASRDSVSLNMSEGGNRQQFRQAVKEDLRSFMDGDLLLKIYNPGGFDVTRQDSRLYNNTAGIASLTIVETTRIFSEALLDILSGGITDEARVCLVLEEAHSLVPEWNSTAYEGDQRAANGTAKAILQARKYGLGTIIVTQRTANVTKTILNQCNTVFALRIFDATGMEFLRNYVGAAYADVLSGLEDRTAILFGRGSSCPSPVIIRINDHEDMLRGFWNPFKASIPVPRDPQEVMEVEEPPF